MGFDQTFGGATKGKSFGEVYNPWQTAGGLLGGGLGMGMQRALGMSTNRGTATTLSRSFFQHTLHGGSGMIGGIASDSILQGIEIAHDPTKRWDWFRTSQAGLSGFVTGIANYRMMRVCFAAGTPLLTPDGSKPIEQFRVGDLLLSRPELDPDGPVETKHVEEVFVRVGRIMNLHVGGQVIRTTAEHPFWVQGKGWTAAVELRVGDLLSSHDEQWIAVEEVYDTDEYETVHNLRVSEFHTYFVGSAEWSFSVWAHNATYAERLGESKVAALETVRAGLSVPITKNQWKGILASAFRQRVWLETAVTRLRESLIRKSVPVHEIDNVINEVIAGTRLADKNAGMHVDLTIPSRRTHILDGDPPPAVESGGHRFGQGVPGKSEFPAWWTDERIIGNVSDIACHPTTRWFQVNGPGVGTTHVGGVPMGLTTRAGDAVLFRAIEGRDGVTIRVIYENAHGEGIITGLPFISARMSFSSEAAICGFSRETRQS